MMESVMAQSDPVLLFPDGAPGETTKLVEKADTDGGKTGGETVLRITDVSEPTITVYPASQELASGAAMVVCPGGGYNILAYDLEGDEVCEWLNDLGVTGMTVTQVMGCGIQKGAGEKYRGVEMDVTVLPKVKVEVVVAHIPVADVIEAAKKVLYTGHVGDGKIFVYSVDQVVKVRTGEEGVQALQDVE